MTIQSKIGWLVAVALALSAGAAQAQMTEVPASAEAQQGVERYFSECDGAVLDGDAEPEPREYELTFAESYDPSRVRRMRLVEYMCFRGAYNFGFSYLLGEMEGPLVPIQFAFPEVDITYAKDADGEEDWETVERIDITGFVARDDIINPSLDYQTMTITSFGKGRGIGDYFSSATWAFREGRFVLIGYVMDASLDGEQEPQLDVSFGPPLANAAQ
ncbi:MAG: DUF1176 domain-containing protein [Pseudomonadota bacterium]